MYSMHIYLEFPCNSGVYLVVSLSLRVFFQNSTRASALLKQVVSTNKGAMENTNILLPTCVAYVLHFALEKEGGGYAIFK